MFLFPRCITLVMGGLQGISRHPLHHHQNRPAVKVALCDAFRCFPSQICENLLKEWFSSSTKSQVFFPVTSRRNWTPRMPGAQLQSDNQNKSTGRRHLCVNHTMDPHFLKCHGTVLLYYHGSKVPLCPNLWRAGVSYLPCLKTKEASSIILLIWTGKCLKNLLYKVLQSLLVICRYEKEKWGYLSMF